MSEAQRLNMVGGHFIWLWTDTSSHTEFFDAYTQTNEANGDDEKDASDAARRGDNGAGRKGHRNSDASDEQPASMHQIRQRQRQRQRNNGQRQQRMNRTPGLNGDIAIEYGNEIVDDVPERVRRDKSNIAPHKINDNVNSNFKSVAKISDESVGYSIDNNSFNVSNSESDRNATLNMKLKRVPVPLKPLPSNADGDNAMPNASTHVFYHHFEDFPVGLLALRPIRMSTDRNFVRSAVRLFANTWAYVDGMAKRRQYQDSVINTLQPHNRPAESATGSSLSNNWAKANEQRRNRNLKWKRTISTVEQLLKTGNAVDETETTVAPTTANVNRVDGSADIASAHTQVNSYLIVNNFNDTNKNTSNIASDLNIVRANHVTLNSNSSNQNKSGLNDDRTQAKSNRSTIVNSNYSDAGAGRDDANGGEATFPKARATASVVTESATNVVDSSVLKTTTHGHLLPTNDINLMGPELERPKRQNTWWSLKGNTWHLRNEQSAGSADVGSGSSGEGLANKLEAPNYVGGCYGNPSEQGSDNAVHFSR